MVLIKIIEKDKNKKTTNRNKKKINRLLFASHSMKQIAKDLAQPTLNILILQTKSYFCKSTGLQSQEN